jgi:hypothetical protein
MITDPRFSAGERQPIGGRDAVARLAATKGVAAIGLSALLVLLVGVDASQADHFPSLRVSIPANLVADLAPVFDFDSDGCLPSAGISRTGAQNPGNSTSGGITEGCRQVNFLETSNTLHRYACAPLADSIYCGHFYALYFLKDQTTGVGGGHTHDWEYAAIWTKDGSITHVSTSAHGNLNTSPISEVPIEGLPRDGKVHAKIVYHKGGAFTHSLRFADAVETAENPYGKFVTPTLISWFEMVGDGVSNAVMRDRLNSFDYVEANIPVNDYNFYTNLNKFKPSGYPTFQRHWRGEICHFSLPFSEQTWSRFCPDDRVVSGVRCSGGYCGTKELLCCTMPGRSPSGPWEETAFFSEEGTNFYQFDDRALVGMRCNGAHCDNISLLTKSFAGSGGTWTPPFSEEQGLGECPSLGYVAGVKCTGGFCDNLSLYCKSWALIAPQPDKPLFFYNATARLGETGRLSATGIYTFVSSISGFSPWTHIVGTSNHALLFYNTSTVEGATARLDAGGKYTYVSSIPGFSRGWTHIAAANSGSLLFYNATTGLGATARLDVHGNYTFVSSLSGFSPWTHIVGTGSGGVLFYNASTGEGATARLDAAGNYTFVGNIPGLSRGWTHIATANAGSLLFYNATTGLGATARLDAAGNYTFVSSIPGFSSWTHIVGTSNGSVLFYNASTGEGATARLDAAGNYTFVSSIPGFSSWTHIVGM